MRDPLFHALVQLCSSSISFAVALHWTWLLPAGITFGFLALARLGDVP